jgi:hypothetical protein
MTRKDYIVIAEALRITVNRTRIDEKAEGGTYPHATSGVMAEEIADALARDNYRFNKRHFLAVVCGEKDIHSRPGRNRLAYKLEDLKREK